MEANRSEQLHRGRLADTCHLRLNLALDVGSVGHLGTVTLRVAGVKGRTIEKFGVLSKEVLEFADALALSAFVASRPDTAVAGLDCLRLNASVVVPSGYLPLLLGLK